MKLDHKNEPDVIAILHEIDRQATILERNGNRQIKESQRMREISSALTAKFRKLKKRLSHGR
jgi:hypothetical protein